MKERVAVLGASDDPTRYANRAQHMLLDYGHTVVPVNPELKEVDGTRAVPDLDSIEGPIDTVTVYLRPQLSESLGDAIVRLKPKRVIFNPGAESPDGLRSRTSDVPAGVPSLFHSSLPAAPSLA